MLGGFFSNRSSPEDLVNKGILEEGYEEVDCTNTAATIATSATTTATATISTDATEKEKEKKEKQDKGQREREKELERENREEDPITAVEGDDTSSG